MGCLRQHQGMPLHPDRSKVPQRHRRSHRPPGLDTVLSCSGTNMVAVAGSSGRRGRRFKSCHPDQCCRRPEAVAPNQEAATRTPDMTGLFS